MVFTALFTASMTSVGSAVVVIDTANRCSVLLIQITSHSVGTGTLRNAR